MTRRSWRKKRFENRSKNEDQLMQCWQTLTRLSRNWKFLTPEMSSAPKISVIWYPYQYIWRLTQDQLMQCWQVNKQLTFGYLSHLWTDFEMVFFKMLPSTCGSKWRIQIWAGIIFSRFWFWSHCPFTWACWQTYKWRYPTLFLIWFTSLF